MPSINLILALAQALHRNGTPAHHLEAALERLSARLGLEARYFASPTAFMSAFGDAGSQRTELLRMEPGSVDLGRLDALEHIADDLSDPDAAAARVREIERSPSPWGLAATLLGHAVASATAARFVGGGLPEVALAAALGATAASTSRLASASPSLSRLGDALAAFVVTALALAASSWTPIAVQLVVLAALVVHVPGFTFTVAMTELASRHLVSGTTRLLGAATTFVELAFGAALAARLFGAFPTVTPVALPAWTELVALAAAPIALPVVLRGRPRDLAPIAVASAVGFAGARVGAAILGPALGAFPAAFAVVGFAHAFHRATRRPAAVPLVPGLLMLVPGTLGLRSLHALVAGDLLAGLELGVTVVMVSASIVAGTLAANAVAGE